MTNPADRIARLRETLAAEQLDGFIIPLTDEHMSEYVGAYARRLEWLTGFQGSAGSAVVTQNAAAIFVDGRYTVQVRAQVDGGLYEYRSIPSEPVHQWLAEHANEGDRIGYDPWLTTRAFLRTAEASLAPRGIKLVPVSRNPVDLIWEDQPSPSAAPAEVLGDEFTGRTSADKRKAIAEALKAAGAGAVILSALDSVAWTLNIRGSDISRTPVVRAFAIVHADGRADLYTDPAKITLEVKAHLGAEVAIEPYEAFGPALEKLGGTVLLDPAWSVAALFEALARGKAQAVEARDPTTLMKAAKNPTELEGMRNAHIRDGGAMAKFLHSLDAAPPGDELEASDRLEAFRRESNLLKDLSFDSISAIGPNAALPHYRSEAATNRRFAGESIYLIDSGGQYPDGTTDITRTVAIATPTAEMKDRYTRVLKGHIALAVARFPRGTRGGQLDILARQFLWSAGLDYAHGTGHGVGHFLGVHDGPQRIAAAVGAPGVEEPLLPGMVLSNEPGFYQEGGYGIRIENLVIVHEDKRDGDLQPMLAFETITLAPIDKRLIEPTLMTAAEIEWLNAYHARVREALSPQLSGAAHDWLLGATSPLPETAQAAA